MLLKLINFLACLLREIEPDSGVINHRSCTDITYSQISCDVSKSDPCVPPNKSAEFCWCVREKGLLFFVLVWFFFDCSIILSLTKGICIEKYSCRADKSMKDNIIAAL